MIKALKYELMAAPICTIGEIHSFAEVPRAEWVIFLDGDVTNMDESNIIDFKKFHNE